jgi:phosphate transport system protein
MTEQGNPTDIVDEQVDELIARLEDEIVQAPGPASRPVLDEEERLVKDSILRMGSLVEDAIRAAADSLVRHDTETALAVIRGDPIVNELQRGTTRLIAVTIATQQPVARDLRYLLTLDHVSYELERIGDHASSVAKQVLKLAPAAPLNGYLHLPEMAERAALLLHGVLRALVDADAQRARDLAVTDDEIDRLYHATFDACLDLAREDPDNVERATRIVIAAHYIERIGDRATNIAEDIVFLSTGEVEDLNP